MSTWGARQERHGAVEIHGEATLHLVEDHAEDLLVGGERLFELDPALLAARLVAREDGLAHGVLDALEIDLDLVTHLDGGIAAGAGELTQGHAALGLQTDIDDRQILLDGDHDALDDGAFLEVGTTIALVEQGGKIFTGGFYGGHSRSRLHCAGVSCCETRTERVSRVLPRGKRRNGRRRSIGGPARRPNGAGYVEFLALEAARTEARSAKAWVGSLRRSGRVSREPCPTRPVPCL